VIADIAGKMRIKTPIKKKVPTRQSIELFNQPTDEEKKTEILRR